MNKSITNVQFRKSFGEVLDVVQQKKRTITVTQHGVPWVVLHPPGAVPCDDADTESAFMVRYKLSDYINAVHYQNKPLIIKRRNTHVATLCPATEG